MKWQLRDPRRAQLYPAEISVIMPALGTTPARQVAALHAKLDTISAALTPRA